MKKTLFIKNAAILTVSSLALRFIGIIFKVWLARVIGSEGIGLYQMIFSVYVLAATFATSGICTAVTRLVADEIALGSKAGVKKIVRVSLKITLFIAIFSLFTLYLCSDFIAQKIIGDAAASLSVKILSLSLFFMGGSSCMRGYFIARSRVTPSAAVQIFEQLIRISVILLALSATRDMGLSYTSAAVFLGDTIAEICAFAILYIIYIKDARSLNHLKGRPLPPFSVTRQIGHIAIPITAGRYMNSGLRTAENILVPKNLAKYRFIGNNALSAFGMIKGMALPVLLFPSTLLGSISTLLIPEISRASALGRNTVVKELCEKIIRITNVVGILCGSLFFVCGERIGVLIYNEQTVGFLLKVLSPIVPLMYLDSVCDGLLKGLDQQAFTFKVSVSDSTLRIIFILIFLPITGLNGFIGIMYFSNIYTCVLNVARLIKKAGAKIDVLQSILLPLLSSLAITLTVGGGLSLVEGLPDLVYIILVCLLSLCLYSVVMIKSGTISIEDIKDVV